MAPELQIRSQGATMSSPATQIAQVDDRHGGGIPKVRRPSDATRHFLRHYVEMVAVMFLGMFVLMAPTGMLLDVFGTSWARLSPAMNTFVMALTMTVPMVAWMRLRGHAWRPNAEMAASMLVPTAVVMVVLSAGLATSGALMVPEHVGMLTCMLVAMLVRREEYSGAGHSRLLTERAIAA
jgi:hypothetical protein